MRSVTSTLSIIDRGEMRDRANGANPANTVLARIEAGQGTRIDFTLCRKENVIEERNKTVIRYLMNLLEYGSIDAEKTIIFQGDDRPIDIGSASWQRKTGGSSISLLPDFYYTQNDGYRNFLPTIVTPWKDRQTKALWRGGTTGLFHQTVEDLARLPRYRLCNIGLKLGSFADFGIYNIVQYRDEESRQAIRAAIEHDGLFKRHIDLLDFQQAKFIVQMDGNGNSWELVKKLRLGCCMLLVGSPWELWHNQFLLPWVHFVPVDQDLSDLEKIAEWCMANDEECRAIADRGRDYALSIDFYAEMTNSATMLMLS